MSDRLFRRGRIWYAWAYENGKQVKKSTGCTDKDAARRKLAELERRTADPDGAAKADAKLHDALDLLYEATTAKASAKTPTRSDSTVSFQKKQARGWLLFAGMTMAKGVADPMSVSVERRKELRELGEKFPLAAFQGGFVDAFMAWRRKQGTVSEGTIGKDLSVMRPAMRYAKRAGIWDGDLERVFPKHELHYEPSRRWLPLDELAKLRAELEPHRFAVVAYAYATSAEPRALERALKSDVADKTATLIHVRGTKRKTRDRWVPILFKWQRDLLAFVRKHADGTDGHQFGKWSNQRRVTAEACERAGIAHASLTSMRHSFAHMMKEGGIRQEDLAVMMGHRDTKMLDWVYARASSPAELLRRCEASAAERRAALVALEGGKSKRKAKGAA